MKKIIPFLKPYRAQLLLAVLLSAASTLCELLLPTIMSDILDKGVYLADLSYILRCCGRMLIVALISLGTVLGGAYLSAQVVAGFCTDLRETVFNRVNNMSFEEFSSIGTSALLSRATHDIGNLSWVASMLSGSVVTIPVLFLGGVLLDKMRPEQAPVLFVVGGTLTALSVIALMLSHQPAWLALFMLSANVFWGLQGAAIPAVIQHHAAREAVGSAYGIINGIGNICAAFIPLLMGMVMRSVGSVSSGFSVLVVSQVVTLLAGGMLLLRMRRAAAIST